MTASQIPQAQVPNGLRTDPPPESGEQIVAWAIDQHAVGLNEPDIEPRWMIAQFAADYPAGTPYWRWSVPGRSTVVRVLGWLPLPALDRYGRYAIGQPDAQANVNCSQSPQALVTKKTATFEEWCVELDREHERIGAPYGLGGCVKNYGAECWRGFYDEGHCPADALSEDAQHAD